MALQAIFWDVDGTLAETERDGHRVAFNRAFVACGLPWSWSEARYGELLVVAGGYERLLRDMRDRSDAPRDARRRSALARRIHDAKNSIYPDLLREVRLPLRAGVMELMQECRSQGVRMAIATTTSRVCVDALLRLHLGADWATWFDALVCGEDVAHKKPDPEVYVRAQLQVRACPLQAVAIEDSPAGAAAAHAAGVPVVLTRSSYFAGSSFRSVAAIGPGLDQRAGWRPDVHGERADGGIGLADLDRWVARARSANARGYVAASADRRALR